MGKKIIITGATGLIGSRICKKLIDRSDELTIFTSNPSVASGKIKNAKEYVKWNYQSPEEWKDYLTGKDAVIHLAGASIAGKRWNNNYKSLILNSREISTHNLVKAISEVQAKPSVFISSSAVGYYGSAGDEIITEEYKSGDDFLSGVCKAWESEAEKVEHFNIRRVSVRTGIVLSPNGGALKQMLPPFKLFLGGPLGTGSQWFPWIHIDDLVKIYLFALDNTLILGSINAASPNPITMNKFAKTLGKILHRPSLFKVPLFALRIVIGEAAEAVVASQRVVPLKLLESGFKFEYENLEPALKDLLKK